MAAFCNAARVLVVDDEPLIGDTLAIILRMHGFDANSVYTADAALETARQTEPDILLSDVCLGAASGIETARRIKELQPRCRIVLLSGALMDDSDWGAIEKYGFELLDKPIHPDELVTHLRAVQTGLATMEAGSYAAE